MSSSPAGLGDDSAAILERTQSEMQGALGGSNLTLIQKIALACRYLADQGHAASLAGQISARATDEGFWTTGFAHGLADASPGNLVRVDPNLTVLEGTGMANPATRFHSWIYAVRPEVRAIVHTHPPYASALAMSGNELIISHMDMTMFHDDVAYLHEWPGVPLANEEGRIIADALGEKNSLILVNHGLLTVGRSLEEAVFLAGSLEHAARMQIIAESAGYRPIPVKDDLATNAKQFIRSEKFVEATFAYWCRLALRNHADLMVALTACHE